MKVVIALVVFVSFTALMNSNVIAANKSTKPDKAGFTKSTEITMQDYSMSVPTYWNSDIYDKDVYRAYCNNDNFVMLIINVDGDMSDFSFENKADRTRFIDSMVTAEDAKAVLNLNSGFSKAMLIEQLISKELLYDVLTSKDGSQFTKEQAEYAFQKLGL